MKCAWSLVSCLAIGITRCTISLAAEPSTAPTMSAIRVVESDGKAVPKVETVARPVPGAGEMLVRVAAAGVNPVDWKMAGRAARAQFTPGFDVSGTVEQIGTEVTAFKPGDSVFAFIALNRGGGYAQYAIVKESEAAAKPAKASDEQAAAVPLVALTAWQALFDTAKLQAGQTVLIHAGAGGVGSMAVQLAKWKGAKVIATASANNLDFLRQIGADQTIDYRTQKFDELVKDVDVVLDPIGGQTQEDSWKVLKKGGVLVSLVQRPSPQRARELGVRAMVILVHPDAQELAQIGKLIDDGSIKPIVTHTFPLADAEQAWEQSQTRHTRGKIVLKVQD